MAGFWSDFKDFGRILAGFSPEAQPKHILGFLTWRTPVWAFGPAETHFGILGRTGLVRSGPVRSGPSQTGPDQSHLVWPGKSQHVF